MILGFLLAIAFNPYTWTAATNPRWELLAVALPICLLFSSPKHFTLTHLFALLFFAWCSLSLIWTPNIWDGLNEWIQLLIAAMAFALGARSATLKPIFIGLAFGLSISSLLLFFPSFRFIPNQPISMSLEGLMGNRDMLGEAAALTAIGLFGYGGCSRNPVHGIRDHYFGVPWPSPSAWLLSGLLPALFIPPLARGALVALVAAFLVWMWSRSRMWAVLLTSLSIFAVAGLAGLRWSSALERIHLWTDSLPGLTFWGRGLGSFYYLFPFLSQHLDIAVARPEHPHNELMELAFEAGAIGVVLMATVVATAFRSADGVSRCLIAGYIVIAMLQFPSHVPVTLFIGALVLGYSTRGGISVYSLYESRGLLLRAWHERTRKPATAH